MMTAWAMAAALALNASAPSLEMPSWEDVIAVPADLHPQFDAYALKQRYGPQERVQRIVEFMLGPEGVALQYDLDTTRTVAETLHSRRGNCLSFTLTFVTLARQAGVDAYVQETDHVLVSLQQAGAGREGNTVYRAGHVNVGVRIRGQRFVIDFDRSIVATARPPKAITDQRALAHYYNNRGAEQMASGSHSTARAFFDAAITLEPDFVSPWNNLGVLHLRNGEPQAAERAYLAALARAPKFVSTLSNLTGLYQQLGEDAKLAAYQRRLIAVQKRDPFHYFLLGMQHESRGDNAQALAQYQRAIGLHRGEPQFYLAAARIYGRLGEPKQAQRARTRAQALFESSFRTASAGFAVRKSLRDY